MELTGKIKLIKEERQVSQKFKLRELVLTDDSTQYEQHIPMQLTQDRCSLLDGYSVGDRVKVQANIKGKEWTSPAGEVKYFATLEIWKIELVSKASEETQSEDMSYLDNQPQNNFNPVQPIDPNNDGLPF